MYVILYAEDESMPEVLDDKFYETREGAQAALDLELDEWNEVMDTGKEDWQPLVWEEVKVETKGWLTVDSGETCYRICELKKG